MSVPMPTRPPPAVGARRHSLPGIRGHRLMSVDRPNSLVFLCYGAGPHTQETLFSLLTLRRFPPDAFRGMTVRVVTDQVDLFGPHGFEIVPLSSAMVEEWAGPD